METLQSGAEVSPEVVGMVVSGTVTVVAIVVAFRAEERARSIERNDREVLEALEAIVRDRNTPRKGPQ